jgi:hypothetical protein
MSEQDLKAELERLKAENEALKNHSSKPIFIRCWQRPRVDER